MVGRTATQFEPHITADRMIIAIRGKIISCSSDVHSNDFKEIHSRKYKEAEHKAEMF